MRARCWAWGLFVTGIVWSGISNAAPMQASPIAIPKPPPVAAAPAHVPPKAPVFGPRLQTLQALKLTAAGREGALRPAEGPLFGKRDRPRIADVRQGRLGDCYFLAVASTIAQRRPELIRSAFQELPDGTVKVRLYRRAGLLFRPVWVRISRRVPHGKDGKQVYARIADEATWPLLLEKAYAALRGGYPQIDRGGTGAEAMEALTGKPAAYQFMAFGKDPPPTAETLKAMEAAVLEGKPVTAGTTTDASLRERLEKLEREAPNSELVARFAKAEQGRAQMVNFGLLTAHAYTVLGFGEKGGTKYVILRNPWGRFTPSREGIERGPDRKTNGVFALSMDEFKTFFRRVTIGNFADADLPAAAPDETIDAVGTEHPEQAAAVH